MEHTKSPENFEKKKLNLFEDFDACVDAVTEIECQWKKSLGPRDRSHLRDKISEALYVLKQRIDSATNEERNARAKRALSGFEGLDGFNRYQVMGDGTIAISASHSIEACLQKAREVGIDVLEY